MNLSTADLPQKRACNEKWERGTVPDSHFSKEKWESGTVPLSHLHQRCNKFHDKSQQFVG